MRRGITYWEDTCKPVFGKKNRLSDGGIVVVGGGLAGISAAYWLTEFGFDDVKIVDCGTRNASYFRNAGHILHGTGEPYKAMKSIYGEENAKTIMHQAKDFCLDMRSTINKHNIDCDYQEGNYYFVSLTKNEENDVRDSVNMMLEDGFTWNRFGDRGTSASVGFKGAYGLRQCDLSASAHPVKFRNALLEIVKARGVEYCSKQVTNVEDDGEFVRLTYRDGLGSIHDAAALCANAYVNRFSEFTRSRGLIEPFRGQIIVSKPLKTEVLEVTPFSMDHGYIYGTFLPDNRLLIGGWRNNIEGGETGNFSLKSNPKVDAGLKQFVKDHFYLDEELEWEYSWSGIMGSANGGLPFIGPTSSPLIYMCAGFTGYGFGWAHGSAKMLAKIMAGHELPDGWNLFNPQR